MTDDETEKYRNHEFERYYKERDELVKAKLKADENYDTLLVTISTLALGASLTKDWVNRGTGASAAFIITAWICFALCLLVSLAHRGLTYYTHDKWIGMLDAAFSDWQPNAAGRAVE